MSRPYIMCHIMASVNDRINRRNEPEIAPSIDGRSNQPSVFDGIAEDSEPVQLKHSHFKAYDCGTAWMRYTVV